ncbi:hypothetical protein J3A83DRAFT_1683975 [Scleroderma citrinum]
MTVIPVFWTRALGDDPTQSNSSQSIFQHVYFIAAVGVTLLLVAWRLYILRRSNRPATEFFICGRRRASPRPEERVYGPSYQLPGGPLAPVNATYRLGQRRVRAADTDADGRRLGRPDDPEWDGKDVLPAYDKVGSPPKYFASEQYPFGSQTQPAEALVSMPNPHIPASENGARSRQGTGVFGVSGHGGEELPPAYHEPRS